jgi:nucleotide-binding universal stress UspA family protein
MAAFKRILVPIDGSDTSSKALRVALDMAKETGGQVRLVHCLNELAYQGEFTVQVHQEARASAQAVLSDGLKVANAAGANADTKLIEFAAQRLGESIADAAREFEADLVVVGSHGRRGMGRVLLGSGAEQIIRTSSVPVLVIRS